MSTHLELFQDLPRIRLSPIKIVKQQSSNTTEDVISSIVDQKGGEDGSERCRTPTSEEHKIPATLSCPPAPRKPRRSAVSCKRKLAELQFFEIGNREELEAFFQSSLFELEGIRSSMKRSGKIITSCQ